MEVVVEKVRSGALESTKRRSRKTGRRSRSVLGVEEDAAGAGAACRRHEPGGRQGAGGGVGAGGGAGIGGRLGL